jgi:hypothetical protein
MIEQAMGALPDMFNVLSQSQDAKMYMAAATFLKTVQDLNVDLVKIHKEKTPAQTAPPWRRHRCRWKTKRVRAVAVRVLVTVSLLDGDRVRDERDFDAVVGDVEEDTAMSVMDRLLIDKEVDAATLCNTTSNYPSDLTSTLGSTVTWASDGGDPEADARTARVAVKARCGKAANALALSWTAFEYLKTSAALKDRVKYTSGQSLSEEQIKNILQVQYLFICKAQKNTNIEGNATQTLSDIWNDSALFFVYDPAPRRKKVCYGIQGIRNEVKSRVFNDEKLGSGDGPVRFVETSWWYNLSAGAVVSSSDSDFAAGYCLANVY